MPTVLEIWGDEPFDPMVIRAEYEAECAAGRRTGKPYISAHLYAHCSYPNPFHRAHRQPIKVWRRILPDTGSPNPHRNRLVCYGHLLRWWKKTFGEQATPPAWITPEDPNDPYSSRLNFTSFGEALIKEVFGVRR